MIAWNQRSFVVAQLSVFVAASVVCSGCAKHTPYQCRTAEQCEETTGSRACYNGHCAFTDPTCSLGLRYSRTGPKPLECVEPVDGGVSNDVVMSDVTMPDAVGPSCDCNGVACGALLPAGCSAARCVLGTGSSCLHDSNTVLPLSPAELPTGGACTVEPFGSECAIVLDQWCKSFGYVGAYGPLDASSNGSFPVLCIGTAGTAALTSSATTLACVAGDPYENSLCVARANELCSTVGFGGGVGSIRQANRELQRICLPREAMQIESFMVIPQTLQACAMGYSNATGRRDCQVQMNSYCRGRVPGPGVSGSFVAGFGPLPTIDMPSVFRIGCMTGITPVVGL